MQLSPLGASLSTMHFLTHFLIVRVSPLKTQNFPLLTSLLYAVFNDSISSPQNQPEGKNWWWYSSSKVYTVIYEVISQPILSHYRVDEVARGVPTPVFCEGVPRGLSLGETNLLPFPQRRVSILSILGCFFLCLFISINLFPLFKNYYYWRMHDLEEGKSPERV